MDQSSDEPGSQPIDVGATLRAQALNGRDEMLNSIEAMRLSHLESTSSALEAMSQFNQEHLRSGADHHDSMLELRDDTPVNFMLDFQTSAAAIAKAAETLSSAVAHTQLQVQAALQAAAEQMLALYGTEGSEDAGELTD